LNYGDIYTITLIYS